MKINIREIIEGLEKDLKKFFEEVTLYYPRNDEKLPATIGIRKGIYHYYFEIDDLAKVLKDGYEFNYFAICNSTRTQVRKIGIDILVKHFRLEIDEKKFLNNFKEYFLNDT